ncbi:hypothetical protein AKJ39_03350 [candidate division MSBL1 archaeon SCGC-AAA259J03]|nr:hypothetical protein AKJ57_06205 [candidate division MSBL1 archaeon SCGC-AAA259A05]KXA97386.1 hypothetical protein AKJ39_03350 [candidate division MSBL1 archaeon SCGC-AAA259J03]KXA98788.1 hypothetical protein AKJ41_06325 [candidate division MSBL1 archaeon SCGC-AAA259O05]
MKKHEFEAFDCDHAEITEDEEIELLLRDTEMFEMRTVKGILSKEKDFDKKLVIRSENGIVVDEYNLKILEEVGGPLEFGRK